MLDILNNFNLRNPTIFEEENIKIPVWAANMNWQPWVGANLQLLFMPQWFPTYWPGLRLSHNEPVEGGFHDWTYGIVALLTTFYNGQFGFKVPVFLKTPTTKPTNWIGGARWSDSVGGLNYSLNYLYTYTTGYLITQHREFRDVDLRIREPASNASDWRFNRLRSRKPVTNLSTARFCELSRQRRSATSTIKE